MNAVEIECFDCKEKFLISSDEYLIFRSGYCHTCIKPAVRHIRNKIVYGFYDIDTVEYETVTKLLESEVAKFERRRYPRIEVNNEKPII